MSDAEKRRDERDAEPKRIQRKRTKGWRMPEGAVFVERPTKWGNPFTDSWCHRGLSAIGIERTPEALVGLYEGWLSGRFVLRGRTPPTTRQIRRWLAGSDLACWCPLDLPCHADVLLEIANAPE